MTKSKLEAQFAFAWRVYGNGVEPEHEYQFAIEIGRKFQFDFAFPEHRLAVEVDGGQWSSYGGGRHNTDKDREKLNIAACLNWRVLRFSGSMLRDPQHVCEVVKWGLGE